MIVALSGKRKAALLLMSLDSATATQLLRSAPPKVMREIAAELAYLHASGKGKKSGQQMIREFYEKLSGEVSLGDETFLRDILGESPEAMEEVYERMADRDPFLQIKNASVQDIVQAVKSEVPQVIAILLEELPNSQGQELLGYLNPDVSKKAVCAMAKGVKVSHRARHKVAMAIERNIKAQQSSGTQIVEDDTKLRQVALLLQGLKADMRENLVGAIKTTDQKMGDTVSSLMVIWLDVKRINDRCMQEALRSLEPKSLALAIYEANAATIEKIQGNVSERLKDMIDEETQLLSDVDPDEINAAREEILQQLREMNIRGELKFDFERSEEDEE